MTGDELRKLRHDAGLSQTELSRIAEITVTTISDWENDKRRIDDLKVDGIKYRLLFSSTEMR